MAKNSSFNDISLDIPGISGSAPNPNFEMNEVAVFLINIGVFSSLEKTDISENNETRLITATEVYECNPVLCDLSVEALDKLDYAMVEFERSSKSVSVVYKTRNDYYCKNKKQAVTRACFLYFNARI